MVTSGYNFGRFDGGASFESAAVTARARAESWAVEALAALADKPLIERYAVADRERSLPVGSRGRSGYRQLVFTHLLELGEREEAIAFAHDGDVKDAGGFPLDDEGLELLIDDLYFRLAQPEAERSGLLEIEARFREPPFDYFSSAWSALLAARSVPSMGRTSLLISAC